MRVVAPWGASACAAHRSNCASAGSDPHTTCLLRTVYEIYSNQYYRLRVSCFRPGRRTALPLGCAPTVCAAGHLSPLQYRAYSQLSSVGTKDISFEASCGSLAVAAYPYGLSSQTRIRALLRPPPERGSTARADGNPLHCHLPPSLAASTLSYSDRRPPLACSCCLSREAKSAACCRCDATAAASSSCCCSAIPPSPLQGPPAPPAPPLPPPSSPGTSALSLSRFAPVSARNLSERSPPPSTAAAPRHALA